MNATRFEFWFTQLCATLADKYGDCIIYMDSCSSHKRQIDKQPTTKWKKADICKWLSDNNISVDPKMLKPELLLRAKNAKVPKHYATVDIAQARGHKIIWTPPYHPELQPIETIWAIVKNAIAELNITSMVDLKKALEHQFFECVTKEQLVGAWRKSQKYEDKYLKVAEESEHAETFHDARENQAEDDDDEDDEEAQNTDFEYFSCDSDSFDD